MYVGIGGKRRETNVMARTCAESVAKDTRHESQDSIQGHIKRIQSNLKYYIKLKEL